jgi:phage terminase small subunit
MRGRRPKPTRLKLLTGNPGKRPFNDAEPRPEPVVPECPPELSELARREWNRLAPELAKLRIVTNLDRAALGAIAAPMHSGQKQMRLSKNMAR